MASTLTRIENLKFSSKITGFMILSLLVLAVVTLCVMQFVLGAQAESEAETRQEADMRVAWNVLGQYGEDFSSRDGKLYVGDQPLDGFYEPVDKIKALVGGTATVFHGDTRIATNVTKPDGSRAIGTKLTDEKVRDAVLVRGIPYRGEADILDVPYFTAYDPIKDRSGKVIGVLYTGIPQSEFLEGVTNAMLLIALVSVIITALVGFGAFAVLGRTFAPLTQLCGLMDRLRQGDTAFAVAGTERSDEIGSIARAITAFRETTIAKDRDEAAQREVVAMIGKHLGDLAAGNLTASMATPFPASYEPIRQDFNRAVDALGRAMTTVVASASAINTGANEISHASDDLAQRTERQATSLAETAAAMDQITASIRASARNTASASATVNQTRGDAQQSAAVVGQVFEAMRAIEKTSGEISDIIALIDGIAFQTNLLALNAGVEAARAGEAGKGFAVVASEVRSLAQRSAEAAGEVKARISGSAVQVENGVKLVSQASDTLSRVFGSIDDISAAVRTLAEAAEQQSSGLERVNAAVTEMNLVTQQNAAMVEQATAAARSLASEADMLTGEMHQFRLAPGDGIAAPLAAQVITPASPPPPRLRAAAGSRSPVLADPDWSEF